MYIIKIIDAQVNILYIKFKLLFLKNKKLRTRYKKFALYSISNKLSNSLKWGISYSVYDSEELLEKSLRSIRKQADYINVVYQTKSWYKEPCSKNLVDVLNHCKKLGLIDELIEYKPDFHLSAGKQELKKRNLGLKYAKMAHCDYFMPMDTDEFYFDTEIEKIKREICIKNITNSFCLQKIYKSPTEQFVHIPKNAVTLFCKINVFSKMKPDKNNIILVDPTRQIHRIFNKKYQVFLDIYMHHYSHLRKDLSKKLRNSSGRATEAVKKSDNTTIKVKDYFKLNEIFK